MNRAAYQLSHAGLDIRVMSAYHASMLASNDLNDMSDPAKEFEAIQTVYGALEPLGDEAQTRVLIYIASLLGIDARIATGGASEEDAADVADSDEAAEQARVFDTFAELYDAANPQSNGEKALVAGYWLQVCQGTESFTAASAQKELADLGHKIPNITSAIDRVKNQKPMLLLQLKKSGSSRQARKLYKVSQQGITRVQEMVGG